MSKDECRLQTRDGEGNRLQPRSAWGDSLTKYICFEELAARIPARLTAATGDHIDREIEHALMQVRVFFQANCCAVTGSGSDKQSFYITHASLRNSISPSFRTVDFSMNCFSGIPEDCLSGGRITLFYSSFLTCRRL